MRCQMISLLVLAFGMAVSPGGAEVLDLGQRRELFVDRFLIDAMEGTALRLGVPQQAGVALQFDAPWELHHCGYVTVFQDGERFRMYYRGLPVSGKDGSNEETTCYAESRDGKTWEKPKLGLFETHGTRENNVILAGMAPFSHNFAPFHDARADAPADQRYKALAGTSESGLVAFVSPDGIAWRKLQETPVITKGAFDSQNVSFWSEAEQTYVCYLRTWTEGDFGGFRSISRCTSPDFVNWTAPVEIDFGGTPREHLYINQTAPYFRAPHLYVSTAARFMPGRKVVSDEVAVSIGLSAGYGNDCSDGVLLTSRGGNVYDRTFMEGFVRPGLGPQNWVSRTNYPACGILQTGPGEMSLYVQHNYGQPTHHLMRYAMRLDGFASLHADYAGGEMTTKPLRFSGTGLYLNLSTSAAGSVKVEVQDADGAPLPGYTLADCEELIGDELERQVAWKGGDLAPLAGKPLRLHFVLKDADIYALQFR